MKIEDLAKALHAAAEGVVLRAVLNPRLRGGKTKRVLDEDADRPSLALIVKAFLAAFIDTGDDKSLDDTIDDIPWGR